MKLNIRKVIIRNISLEIKGTIQKPEINIKYSVVDGANQTMPDSPYKENEIFASREDLLKALQ